MNLTRDGLDVSEGIRIVVIIGAVYQENWHLKALVDRNHPHSRMYRVWSICTTAGGVDVKDEIQSSIWMSEISLLYEIK